MNKRTQVGAAGHRFGNKAGLILGVLGPRLCSLGEEKIKEGGKSRGQALEQVTVGDKQNEWRVGAGTPSGHVGGGQPVHQIQPVGQGAH